MARAARTLGRRRLNTVRSMPWVMPLFQMLTRLSTTCDRE